MTVGNADDRTRGSPHIPKVSASGNTIIDFDGMPRVLYRVILPAISERSYL